MIERRHRQEGARRERPDPREVHERVGLPLDVVHAGRLGLEVVGHLVRVAPHGRHEPQLVVRIDVEEERAEPAKPALPVVKDVGHRGLEAEVAAVAGHAGVVREALAVPADTHLVVRLRVAPGAQDDLGVVVPLESRSRDHVEHRVGAIAELRVVAAPMHLQVVGVLRVDLRPDVAGDVRVRHRHAVHQPAHLVAAADVQLIVGDVGARHERRDHRHAVRPARPRRVGDVAAVDERGRRHRRRSTRPPGWLRRGRPR